MRDRWDSRWEEGKEEKGKTIREKGISSVQGENTLLLLQNTCPLIEVTKKKRNDIYYYSWIVSEAQKVLYFNQSIIYKHLHFWTYLRLLKMQVNGWKMIFCAPQDRSFNIF